jgi:hypothetical protein
MRRLLMKAAVVSGLAALSTTGTACAQDHKAYTDPAEAGPDYAVQGEYAGEVRSDEGPKKIGVQVIALGDGKFMATAYVGGLPGEGWERGNERFQVEGKTTNGVTVFKGERGEGRLSDGVLTVYNSGGQKIGELKRVERASPTLGAKPPEGAIVLFDGTSLDAFEGGTLTPDGLLLSRPTARSKRSFGSFHLHLEFRTPFMPTATGQARGNSGVYLQNCYEIQVLDSFGLEGRSNECGGIYSVQEPRLNMCLPPLVWQTYDVEFTAPKFDAQGKKTANARVSVKHNGVSIYEDLELPRLTPGGASEEAPKGPLMLQDHGNPVTYRNIWIVERE